MIVQPFCQLDVYLARAEPALADYIDRPALIRNRTDETLEILVRLIDEARRLHRVASSDSAHRRRLAEASRRACFDKLLPRTRGARERAAALAVQTEFNKEVRKYDQLRAAITRELHSRKLRSMLAHARSARLPAAAIAAGSGATGTGGTGTAAPFPPFPLALEDAESERNRLAQTQTDPCLDFLDDNEQEPPTAPTSECEQFSIEDALEYLREESIEIERPRA